MCCLLTARYGISCNSGTTATAEYDRPSQNVRVCVCENRIAHSSLLLSLSLLAVPFWRCGFLQTRLEDQARAPPCIFPSELRHIYEVRYDCYENWVTNMNNMLLRANDAFQLADCVSPLNNNRATYYI